MKDQHFARKLNRKPRNTVDDSGNLAGEQCTSKLASTNDLMWPGDDCIMKSIWSLGSLNSSSTLAFDYQLLFVQLMTVSKYEGAGSVRYLFFDLLRLIIRRSINCETMRNVRRRATHDG